MKVCSSNQVQRIVFKCEKECGSGKWTATRSWTDSRPARERFEFTVVRARLTPAQLTSSWSLDVWSSECWECGEVGGGRRHGSERSGRAEAEQKDEARGMLHRARPLAGDHVIRPDKTVGRQYTCQRVAVMLLQHL